MVCRSLTKSYYISNTFFTAGRKAIGGDDDGLDEQQSDAVVTHHGRAHRHRPSPRHHRRCHHHRHEGTTKAWSVDVLDIVAVDVVVL